MKSKLLKKGLSWMLPIFPLLINALIFGWKMNKNAIIEIVQNTIKAYMKYVLKVILSFI